MTHLIGAWSLSREHDSPRVDRDTWRAMTRTLSRSTGAARRIERPRLWLQVAQGQWAASGGVGAAIEGVIAGDEGRLREVVEGRLEGRAVTPDGPFVLACHDPREAGSVTLVRGLSGGERLYFARVDDVVFFSASARPLLAHPRIEARVPPALLDEVLLTGRIAFGDASLHEGIREVLPGHSLTLRDDIGEQRWCCPDALRSPEGDPATLARRFREALTEAVARAAGPSRPVAVALSGGIDSSAIAAAAVEAFGADNVVAYTYEFDDPTHSTEIEYAKQVCAALGIRQHETFTLSPLEYVRSIPEMIWRSECFAHWPKAFMLMAAREIAARGHDRYLTGFGIGSHMGFFSELSALLAQHARPPGLQWLWYQARFGRRWWPFQLQRLHPSLEPPHPRLYFMMTRLMHHAGVFESLRPSFPEAMWPMLERLRDVDALEPWLRDADWATRGQRLAFSHLLPCIDVTRSEKASREVGAARVAPAHFASCLPYAFFPPSPAPRLWSAERALRPGKYLVKLAYRGILPDAVIDRKKSWGDAVASPVWISVGRVMMLEALPGFPGRFARLGADYEAAVRFWEPHSILATSLSFRLWERMFVDETPGLKPPTWKRLGASMREFLRERLEGPPEEVTEAPSGAALAASAPPDAP